MEQNASTFNTLMGQAEVTALGIRTAHRRLEILANRRQYHIQSAQSITDNLNEVYRSQASRLSLAWRLLQSQNLPRDPW